MAAAPQQALRRVGKGAMEAVLLVSGSRARSERCLVGAALLLAGQVVAHLGCACL